MSDHAPADPFAVRPLRRGAADPLFVLDFPTFSARRRLSDLLAAHPAARPLYRLDPLAALLDEPVYASLEVFAAAYAPRIARLCDDGTLRPTVIGYCSAGALALRVAALLAPVHPEVRVLLVRPAWQDRAALYATFRESLLELGRTDPPVPDGSRPPAALLAWMGAQLERELERLAAGHGLSASDEAFAELLSRHRGWLSFVLACADAPPARLPAGLDVLSLEGTAPGAAVALDPPRPYRIARHALLDEAEILVPELAALVLSHLAPGPGARGARDLAQNGVSADA